MWNYLYSLDKQVAAAILGGCVAGLFAIIALLIGWYFDGRRWRRERQAREADWRRETEARESERRRDLDARDAEWRRDHNAENTAWQREKALTAYSDAVYYLFKLGLSAQKADLDDKDVRQQLSESRRHLVLIRSHSPHVSQEIDAFLMRLNTAMGDTREGSLAHVANELAHRLVDLIAMDERFHQ